MKKIIAFIILVILVIVMIVLSYNFYSGNNKNAAKNKLNNSLKVTKKKTSDVVDSVTRNNSTNNNETNSNDSNSNSSNNTDENITVEEDSVVPDTASNDDSGYIKIDHYTVSVDKSTLKVGETSKIHVNVFPRNASEREVSFVSSDNSILKVNSFGKMKALSSGEVVVTIKVKNCDDYNLKINVK